MIVLRNAKKVWCKIARIQNAHHMSLNFTASQCSTFLLNVLTHTLPAEMSDIMIVLRNAKKVWCKIARIQNVHHMSLNFTASTE